MNWQDIDKYETNGNAWTLRRNTKSGDYGIQTTEGGIKMSAEDGKVTVCITGIGYIDATGCAEYAETIRHAAEAAARFQKVIDAAE